ncbi:MAG: MMPL family transporter, partial [Deltaproteobacteria bacterium]|nr:MMPL family transporter [Deltaproteobacteria bacterium]
MNFFSKLILRHAGLILFVGFLLTATGAYYSVQLYKNLRTDIEELLPTTVRSILDLDEVTTRLESVENLAVLIFSNNTTASKKFATDLGERLKKAPKKRRPLYMELDDLVKIKDYIKNRIEYERSLYNPLNIFTEDELPEPYLDFRGMRKKYDKKVSAFSRFPDGYYATPDEKKRVVLVYAPGKVSGYLSIQRLKNYVVDIINELNPKSYAPDIEIKYTGGVQNLIEEQAALLKDLSVSTIIVILLVTLALFIFFKNILATIALLLSLFMGVCVTFGVSYFWVGYLNANSAFMGSIIIGNGINFGIIYLARYLEERRKGKNIIRATNIAMTHTSTATWTAALAAGLAYGSLVLTGFRGFQQFGHIGLMGMVFCWISAFSILPSCLVYFDKWFPMGEKKFPSLNVLSFFSYLKFFLFRPLWKKHFFSRTLANLINRFPSELWAITFIITLLSATQFVLHYQTSIIETDLTKLRNKKSLESGSAFLWKHVDEIFQRYISPLIILPKKQEDALAIAEALKEKKAREGKTSSIAA